MIEKKVFLTKKDNDQMTFSDEQEREYFFPTEILPELEVGDLCILRIGKESSENFLAKDLLNEILKN